MTSKGPRNGFSSGEARERLREAIKEGQFGRFADDMTDDPVPHILYRLLDDIDELRSCLLLIAHARDDAQNQLVELLPNREATRVLKILEETR